MNLISIEISLARRALSNCERAMKHLSARGLLLLALLLPLATCNAIELTQWGSRVVNPLAAKGARFQKISSTSEHNLALTTDGRVVGWGLNEEGECTGPAAASNVVDIATGDFHNLVLAADGTIRA